MRSFSQPLPLRVQTRAMLPLQRQADLQLSYATVMDRILGMTRIKPRNLLTCRRIAENFQKTISDDFGRDCRKTPAHKLIVQAVEASRTVI